jgi:Skp family chaperone for outer membrane proteins
MEAFIFGMFTAIAVLVFIAFCVPSGSGDELVDAQEKLEELKHKHEDDTQRRKLQHEAAEWERKIKRDDEAERKRAQREQELEERRIARERSRGSSWS